jgi:hypothetical protein
VNGLNTAQPAFVAGIEAHRALMVEESPPRDVLSAKTHADLRQISNLLCGGAPLAKPRPVMDGW